VFPFAQIEKEKLHNSGILSFQQN